MSYTTEYPIAYRDGMGQSTTRLYYVLIYLYMYVLLGIFNE